MSVCGGRFVTQSWFDIVMWRAFAELRSYFGDTVLLIIQSIVELVQMTRNMTSFDFKYFKEVGNLLDMGIIILLTIILFDH